MSYFFSFARQRHPPFYGSSHQTTWNCFGVQQNTEEELKDFKIKFTWSR